MPNKNYVLLQGHLGQNPELKQTKNGKPVCNLSLATSDGPKDKRETEWHKIVLWGFAAERAANWTKGDAVEVEGKIKTRSWEKDGVKHYTTEVHSFEARRYEREPKNSAAGQDQAPSAQSLDDLPF